MASGDDVKASVLERSGAAGRALECDGSPYRGGTGISYEEGLAFVQDSPVAALREYFEAESTGVALSTTGYRIEREDEDRALFSYDVKGRTKVAFIAADSVVDARGDRGWGVESDAACDSAELPAEVTEDIGIEVWQDAAGRRVPLSKIRSSSGSGDCLRGISSLSLNGGPLAPVRRDPPQYFRDPGGELAGSLRGTYADNAELPADARDTGYQREGRRLWLAADKDAAYLVSTDNPDDVECWPVASGMIGCG